MSRVQSSVCYVLREDPGRRRAGPQRRSQAIETVVAREVQLPVGAWPDRSAAGQRPRVAAARRRPPASDGIDHRFGAELLGEGDVLRPPYQEGESTLTLTNDWLGRAVGLALLDERFVVQLSRFPLAGRLLRARSRARASSRSIWQSSIRLGGRAPAPALLAPRRPLGQSPTRRRRRAAAAPHAVLSDLVAARRPTVTSALSELGKRGLLRPVDEGWLLSGDPPAPVDADGAVNGAGTGHRS